MKLLISIILATMLISTSLIGQDWSDDADGEFVGYVFCTPSLNLISDNSIHLGNYLPGFHSWISGFDNLIFELKGPIEHPGTHDAIDYTVVLEAAGSNHYDNKVWLGTKWKLWAGNWSNPVTWHGGYLNLDGSSLCRPFIHLIWEPGACQSWARFEVIACKLKVDGPSSPGGAAPPGRRHFVMVVTAECNI